MVEDDDELGGLDEPYDRRSDAFGLDGAASSIASRRDTSVTTRSNASRDVRVLADAQAQIADLQERNDALENSLKKREDEIMRLESAAIGKSGVRLVFPLA